MSLNPETPESAESPESPPSPSPAPPSRISRLFAPIPSSSPSPGESSSPSQSPTGGPDAPPWSTDAPADPQSDHAEPSDTPSTGKGLKLSKQGLRSGLGVLFRQSARLLAAVVAVEVERDLGVWEPDPEDIDDVSRPATNIIYRRLPDDAKGGDVIDLFALGLALVAYASKNLQRRAQVRTMLQLKAEQGVDMSGEAPAP